MGGGWHRSRRRGGSLVAYRRGCRVRDVGGSRPDLGKGIPLWGLGGVWVWRRESGCGGGEGELSGRVGCGGGSRCWQWAGRVGSVVATRWRWAMRCASFNLTRTKPGLGGGSAESRSGAVARFGMSGVQGWVWASGVFPLVVGRFGFGGIVGGCGGGGCGRCGVRDSNLTEPNRFGGAGRAVSLSAVRCA